MNSIPWQANPTWPGGFFARKDGWSFARDDFIMEVITPTGNGDPLRFKNEDVMLQWAMQHGFQGF